MWSDSLRESRNNRSNIPSDLGARLFRQQWVQTLHSQLYFALQILDACGQVKQRSPPRISASSIQVGWIIRRPNEVGSPWRIRLNFFWDMNDNLYTISPFSIICMTDLLSCFRASISKNPNALSSHEASKTAQKILTHHFDGLEKLVLLSTTPKVA